MIYIDSNFFIYAKIDSTKLGKNCRDIMELLENGKFKAISSVLVLDEITWIVKKHAKTYQEAIDYAKNVTELNNLEITNTSISDFLKATDLMKSGLTPRDAMHAATSMNRGVFSILSDDSDFDKIKKITRFSFEKFLKKIS